VLVGKTMGGSIPSCIMNLPRLRVLSLSANRLTGKIGNTSVISSSLVNLSFAHNYLSGMIPSALIEHNFTSLDLSYNKLHGYVHNVNHISYNSRRNNILYLSVNRLSGAIPDFITYYDTVDILSGNIFGCHNVISNDKNSDTYICGSGLFNLVLILLAILISFVMIIYVIYSLLKSVSMQYQCKLLYSYISILDSFEILNYIHFYKVIYFIKKIISNIIILTCVIILSTLPIYILKFINYAKEDDLQYSTHSKTYAWILTTAYITGELPASLLLLAWFCSICTLLYTLNICNTKDINMKLSIVNNTSNSSSIDTDPISYTIMTNSAIIKFILLVILNICIVSIFNALYVYLTLQQFEFEIEIIIQLCFAVIKYIWNFIIVPSIIFSPLPISPMRGWLKLTINIINSVFIPCFASLFTSVTCFQVRYLSLYYNTIFY
jgi:hypothetical protein